VTPSKVRAAVASMLKADKRLAAEDIKAAAAKAKVGKGNLSAFDDLDYLAINPHLPEMWRAK
jgi:hypothetical protein